MRSTVVCFLAVLVLLACARLPEARRHARYRTVTGPSRTLRTPSRNGLVSFPVSSFGAQSYCNITDPNNSRGVDSTLAFQQALDKAGEQVASGLSDAEVFFEGCYWFDGSLTVPPAVTLRGVYTTVPSHDMRSSAPENQPTDGSVLYPLNGRGNATAMPFITVKEDATLQGFVVFYPTQSSKAAPVEFPWTISMVAPNSAVMDVELLNPFNGISAVEAHRHYIARVQGQPLNTGVFVDSTYDIGRIEDVHFNPWFSDQHPFIEFQLVHGRAFVFGRSDWEYVLNTFAFGYAVGYHFVQTPTGEMNGNFVGIGADLAINASVQVDAAQAPGLLITNGEFTAFHTDDWLPNATVESTQVVISSTNTGPVKFVDSSFWGPSSQIAMIHGTGTTSFSSCEFVQWDLQAQDGRAGIRSFGGNLVLQGNEFMANQTQVELGPQVKKAVIVGNVMSGTQRIVNNAKATVEIGYNAADSE